MTTKYYSEREGRERGRGGRGERGEGEGRERGGRVLPIQITVPLQSARSESKWSVYNFLRG